MSRYDGVGAAGGASARGRLDLQAVQRDAELVDALSGRQHGRLDNAQPDPVAGLLMLLTAEVDEGLAALASDPAGRPARGVEMPSQRVVPIRPPARDVPRRVDRRRVACMAVAATVAIGVLSVSGVAAAVTGSPFTPYSRVYAFVSGHHDGTAADAAAVAAARRQMEQARAAMARGDAAAARTGVSDTRRALSHLPAGERARLRAEIAAFEKDLDRTNHPGRPAVPPATSRANGNDGTDDTDDAATASRAGSEDAVDKAREGRAAAAKDAPDNASSGQRESSPSQSDQGESDKPKPDQAPSDKPKPDTSKTDKPQPDLRATTEPEATPATPGSDDGSAGTGMRGSNDDKARPSSAQVP